MKRILPILALFLTCFGQAFSQNYFILNKVGTGSDYVMTNASAAILLTSASGTLNDVLSTQQTLPFNFNFYGQAVTSFKASDNGYITFNSSTETVSRATQSKLPDTASTTPKNAIFAFWEDLQLQTDGNFPGQIATWTYGTAPNRVFVIQWRVVSPKGSSGQFAYFAIRLYEAGYFDVVHNYGYGTYACTVGCQNSTGTVGLAAPNSGSIGLGWSNGNYTPNTSVIFEFHYATMKNDIALYNPSLVPTNNPILRRTVPTLIKGDVVNFAGSIYNFGTNTIKTYTINYSIDGATPVTKVQVSTLDSLGGYESVPLPAWTVVNPGQFHTIKTWISSVNGLPLVDTSSYSAQYSVFVINGTNETSAKKVLVEEGSGAWCGYCPDGHHTLSQILDNDPNVIGVVNHNSDGMALSSTGEVLNSTYQVGFPYGTVDRHLFNDANINSSTVGLSRNVWAQAVTESENTPSIPVKLDILTKSWDASTSTISFTVTGSFADYAGGDIRINAYVLEDSVRGPDKDPDSYPGAGWDQHNYYSKNWPSGVNDPSNILYNEPPRIVGYFHNHVLRAMLTPGNNSGTGTGTWGAPLLTGTARDIAAPQSTFTKTYTIKLPTYSGNPGATVNYSGKPNSGYAASDAFFSTIKGTAYNNPQNIKLVAFVSMYNASDPTYCEVLNATEVPLLGWSAGIAKYNQNVDKISLYPNPAQNSTNVEYTLLNNTDLTIDVYNVMGQKVQSVATGNQVAGLHTMNLDASHLTNGLYFVTFTSNGEKTTKQLMIQK